MKNEKLTGFAEACYEQNSEVELIAALNAEPDKTDCETWGISAAAWRSSIELALAEKRGDAE